jgi:hypothetical protein
VRDNRSMAEGSGHLQVVLPMAVGALFFLVLVMGALLGG